MYTTKRRTSYPAELDSHVLLGYSGGGGSGGGGGYLPGTQGSQNSPGGAKVSWLRPLFMLTLVRSNDPHHGCFQQRDISASLRPVMIRQILDATQEHGDADFMIDGSDPTQVSIAWQ